MERTIPTKHENRSCLTKAKYLKGTAKRAARAMRLKFREKNIKAYRCKYCIYWHIGHAKRV